MNKSTIKMEDSQWDGEDIEFDSLQKGMENSEAELLTRSSYESDLQQIEDLMTKYQMHDEQDVASPDEPFENLKDEKNEGEEKANLFHNEKSYNSEETSDAETIETIVDAAEENCDVATDENSDVRSSESFDENETDKQRTGDILESQSHALLASLETNKLDDPADDENAQLAMEDVNANTKKTANHSSITMDFIQTNDHPDNYSLWQNDFNEDSETFQIFQIPAKIEYGSEPCGQTFQDTDIFPETDSIPNEITSSEIFNCDSKIEIEPELNVESRKTLKSVNLTPPMIQRQVELYTKWYQNLKEILVPLTCSCTSYNVFSMARKLTVLSLVLMALLYSMLVPSPADYEYDITRGLGPQALYYYKLAAGKKGYHQVNNLLFDTGQVYPPPKKEVPTMQPPRYRKRKRRRRKLPSHVRQVLPLVMRQQVEAVENGKEPRFVLSRRQYDYGDRFYNANRNVQVGDNYREARPGDRNNGVRSVHQQGLERSEVEVMNQDDKYLAEKLQVNHYNADIFTSGEFYKIQPGAGEMDIILKKGDCGEFCMFRINFRKQPDGLNESRMVMWSQWSGVYKLKGLDKDSTYWVEICQYGNKGSTNNCDSTEAITY